MTWTFFWRTRSGARCEVSIGTSEYEEARRLAMECGYPGHKGGLWNYLVADVTAFIRRLTHKEPNQ